MSKPVWLVVSGWGFYWNIRQCIRVPFTQAKALENIITAFPIVWTLRCKYCFERVQLEVKYTFTYLTLTEKKWSLDVASNISRIYFWKTGIVKGSFTKVQLHEVLLVQLALCNITLKLSCELPESWPIFFSQWICRVHCKVGTVNSKIFCLERISSSTALPVNRKIALWKNTFHLDRFGASTMKETNWPYWRLSPTTSYG